MGSDDLLMAAIASPGPMDIILSCEIFMPLCLSHLLRIMSWMDPGWKVPMFFPITD